MDDLIAKVTDVHKTLSYGSTKLGLKFLGLGLLGLAAGAVLIWLQPKDFGAFQWMMVWLTFVVCGACTVYGLVRWRYPKPMLVISPAGLRQTIDFVKTIVIPWHEVRGVDSIDISGRIARQTYVFQNLTVVLVTRQFYDRHIHVNSLLGRGPAWELNYIPKGDDMVQVALHHDVLPATAAELRTAVETRWHAFRDKKPATVPRAGAQAIKPNVS